MNRRLFLSLLTIALCWTAVPLRAAPPAAEQKKIDSLLRHVSGLSDARFIRNGKEYDAKTAAKFLRKKGEANRKKIITAEDFIKVAATKSSTSGKAYLIRFNGKKAVLCGDYLRDRLDKMKDS